MKEEQANGEILWKPRPLPQISVAMKLQQFFCPTTLMFSFPPSFPSRWEMWRGRRRGTWRRARKNSGMEAGWSRVPHFGSFPNTGIVPGVRSSGTVPGLRAQVFSLVWGAQALSLLSGAPAHLPGCCQALAHLFSCPGFGSGELSWGSASMFFFWGAPTQFWGLQTCGATGNGGWRFKGSPSSFHLPWGRNAVLLLSSPSSSCALRKGRSVVLNLYLHSNYSSRFAEADSPAKSWINK